MNEVSDKDACELLDADHIAVKHLFVEYARLALAGAGTSAADRRGAEKRADPSVDRGAVARRICAELTVHARIEEEIFYPALRQAGVDAALLDQAEAEHAEVKALIARIEALPAADATMDDLVAKLANAVEHHVKEERDRLFPKARVGLDLEALGAQMKERQEEL